MYYKAVDYNGYWDWVEMYGLVQPLIVYLTLEYANMDISAGFVG